MIVIFIVDKVVWGDYVVGDRGCWLGLIGEGDYIRESFKIFFDGFIRCL